MRRHLRGVLAVSLAVAVVIMIAVSQIGDGRGPDGPADPSATPTVVETTPTVTGTPNPSPARTAVSPPAATLTVTPTPSPAPPSATPIPTQPGPTPTTPPAPTATPTPEPTPTPTPPGAAAMAMAVLAGDRDLLGKDLSLLDYEPVEWRTSLLGCPGSLGLETGETYSGAVTPGWRVFIAHNDDTYEYRIDRTGDRIVTCDEHAPPGPETVNVAERSGLAATERVEIARFDPGVGAYRLVGIVDDPGEIAKFVDLLDLDMPLEPRVECEPVMRIDYVVAGQPVTFWFWCAGDVHVLQGEQPFWGGRRGITPVEFSKLIGPYAAMMPMPGYPPR